MSCHLTKRVIIRDKLHHNLLSNLLDHFDNLIPNEEPIFAIS